jgi:isoleucyl-tRNA synthetase
MALNVLFNVLLKTVIMMAPFTPFITEMFYSNLKLALAPGSKYLEKSVHFVNIPEFRADLIDE